MPGPKSNVQDINLHIAAWQQAAIEARAAGKLEEARVAESKAIQLQFVRDRNTL